MDSFWRELEAGGAPLVEANGHVRSVLVEKRYPHRYAEIPGGHEPISWRGTLPDGILALLGTDDPITAGG